MEPQFKWKETSADAETVRTLARALELPLPVARVLVARGVTDPAAAQRFLNPNLRDHLGAPFDFPGVRITAERLWQAIRDGRDIVVYGDFDADGVAAAALLVTALQRLGGAAEVFLPLRESEGYGLTRAALDRCLRERGGPPGVLVTVDCGISSPHEVAYLTSLGVEVIITDHHELNGPLPEAAAIVNPKLGASPGAEHLCGAGVAFKLAHALADLGKANGWYQGAPLGGELLVPAGLATVTDIVPLTGENRLLVWSALKYWRHYAGPGLQALLARAARQTMPPDAYTFGFVLGPRINAAGRMESAMTAFELLTTRDRDRAAELAAHLEGCNARRRGVEERIVLAARKQCGLDAEDAVFDAASVVVGGEGPHVGEEEGWHPGVIGIVAARLCDDTGRPAAVVSFGQDGAGRGSVRAGEGYHALEALAAADEALAGYGGHASAAGFHLKPGAFDSFKQLFNAACARQAAACEDGLPRSLTVDGWLEPETLTLELHREIQRLAPFGNGNPAPRWGVRGVTAKEIRPLGASGDHLLCMFERDGYPLPRGVWFRNGDALETLRSASAPLDVVFELRENNYGGESSVELQIVDAGNSEFRI